MSLLFSRALGDTNNQLIPTRSRSTGGSVSVTAESAMAHSAVWACLMLRSGLISTMPLKVFRQVDGFHVDAASTPFLDDPAGDGFGIEDWMASSQLDLDRAGNCFGLITARDGFGLPAIVELVEASRVSVIGHGPRIAKYRIGGHEYEPAEVWHERQFTIPGFPLGLSPVAKAAMSIGSYMSAQQFASDWFAAGGIPSGRLKNVNRTLDANEARIVKERYKSAVASRDVFVHGADWEYDMISVNANESQFLETMRYGVVDVARWFGIPGDLIDAEVQHQSKITYANITQRNLQFLVMNLGTPVRRREKALSRRVLPRGRFVEIDTDSLLRMDPQTLQSMLVGSVEGRILAPSEARRINNRQPFTPEQIAEFAALNPPPAKPVGDTP
jgi:HK97 family phage portal protein